MKGFQRLNYTTHAIDDLVKIGKLSHQFMPWYLPWLIGALRSAVKFQLPENAAMLEDVRSINASLAPLIRPPYPVTVMEYPNTLGGPKRVITLAVDSESKFAVGPPPGWRVDADLTKGFATLVTVACDNQTGIWVPTTNAILPYGQRPISLSPGKCRLGLVPLPFPYVDDFQRITLQQVVDEMYLDINAVTNTCLCTMCDNVEVQSVPSPKFPSDARVKKGKEPFFEVKVLRLRPGQSGSETGRGSHASPALHLRRGHIRRLSGDRLTWVRSALVGDKTRGLIVKDYLVE